MTSPAPICLFVFNRLEHTQKTVEHLLKNELSAQSDLFVFSDGPRNPEEEKKVVAVRNYVQKITGFRSVQVIERKENWGLAKSIIAGVSEIVGRYDKVIVLEDDLITSPYFLQFMNDGLQTFEDDLKVGSIHGYVYPIEGLPETFFLRGADCWGWATWKNRWQHFNPDGKTLLIELKRQRLGYDFDYDGNYPYMRMLKNQIAGRNNSWAIRWHASIFLKDMYTLYPGKSLVANIGFDSSGTHCSESTEYDVAIHPSPLSVRKILVQNDPLARKSFVNFFDGTIPSLRERIQRKLLSIFKKLRP